MSKIEYPTKTWPDIKEGSIPLESREFYTRAKASILAYEVKHSLNTIQSKFGFAPAQLYRLIARCQTVHEDGQLWGFRVLIKNIHIRAHNRRIKASPVHLNSGKGTKGLFRLLMTTNIALSDYVEHLAKTFVRDRRHGNRPRIKECHIKFIRKCRESFSDSAEYPLCLKSKGEKAFNEYFRALTNELELKTLAHASSSARRSASNIRPYMHVEIDAHKLDCHLTIKVKKPGRDSWMPRLIDRLWVLVAKDRESRSPLAWHLAISKEIDRLDLLRCVRKISEPWSPMQITIPGLEYIPGSGFPSGIIQNCAGRMADMIHLDNAMAHLAIDVRQIISEEIGATINWGEAAEPNFRPFIEAFFRSLTEGAIQPLPFGFVRDRTSIKWAIKNAEWASPTIDEMLQYLDVVMAASILLPMDGLFGETPHDVLTRDANNGFIRRDMSSTAGWRRLTIARKTFSIITKPNRRPYVNLLGVQYYSPSLISMVRQKIDKFEGEYDLEDLRTINPIGFRAWSPQSLVAQPPWNEFQHDIRMRRLVIPEIKSKKLDISSVSDPKKAIMQHLQIRAVEEKSAATALARGNSKNSFEKQNDHGAPVLQVIKKKRPPNVSPLVDLVGHKLQSK